MPRLILFAILFTSPLSAMAQSDGYGVDRSDSATEIREAMLSNACSEWSAANKAALYSKVNIKCHALKDMKSFDCYEDASKCLGQAMNCMSKDLNPALQCFFDTYTTLQKNLHLTELATPSPAVSGSSDAAGY